ncbi:MAG TPA: tryptophan synthase subunit alpha [Candidatus Marinimicrobia bacterium]|nr:tryptophan synthase subunit alpha [Candidatus Neomarinimicrobiota bacterium]
MNYAELFHSLKRKNETALITFTVIGDPNYQMSLKIVKNAIQAGADILELGLPFSDPTADGPTIQAADQRALQAGITIDKCFEFLREVRSASMIPIGLLIYANLVYRYGIEEFYAKLSDIGVNSVLVADVPIEEATPFIKAARNSAIDTVFLVSPLTSNERLTQILAQARGFVYLISRLGVTGTRNDVQDLTIELIKRIKQKTQLPVAVGFGISSPKQVETLARTEVDGIIIGSAIVKIIEENIDHPENISSEIGSFIASLKNATRDDNKIS